MSDLNEMVNELVKPEHQYKDVADPPLDNVRMAWPFKTEEELRAFSKWYKEQEKSIKKKQIDEHKEQHGEAFL